MRTVSTRQMNGQLQEL